MSAAVKHTEIIGGKFPHTVRVVRGASLTDDLSEVESRRLIGIEVVSATGATIWSGDVAAAYWLSGVLAQAAKAGEITEQADR